MEKAAVAGVRTGWGCKPSMGRCLPLALALGAPCAPLLAQQQPQPFADVLVAEAPSEPPPGVRVQVRTSSLPRLDAPETGFHAPRVDVSLSPASGKGLAPVLGMSTAALTSPGLQQQRTGLDVGLRWSHGLQSQHQIDVTAWRRMNVPDDAYSLAHRSQPVYGARFELNLTPVRKPGLAIERGFVGMQLEGGGRITIRRRNGGPMVYYRTNF